MSYILIGTAVKKKSDKEKVATQQRMDKENLFSTSEKEKNQQDQKKQETSSEDYECLWLVCVDIFSQPIETRIEYSARNRHTFG